MKKLYIIIGLCLFLTSCASKPVLYPNSKLKKIGKERAQKDINKCMTAADKYLESSKGKKILKGAGKGAFLGAAMGAISGLIFGDIEKALVSGAAIGAVGGSASAAISPDQLKQKYTNYCLSKKGYKVMGWD